jgi:6-phosphogluconolactonase
MSIQWTVLDDEAQVARAAADWLIAAVGSARAPCAVCLSGGSTPKVLYGLLATDDYRYRIPWQDVHWFWGDERFVGRDDARSNFRMVFASLLSRVPVPAANIHPVDTSLASADAAARAYEQTLVDFHGSKTLDVERPLFAATLLGVGPDGHTASLFPGSPLLAETRRWAAASEGERPESRITLTYPVLDNSRTIAFLACGSGKRDVLASLQAGADLPAGRISSSGSVRWFIDRAAAPASRHFAQSKHP